VTTAAQVVRHALFTARGDLLAAVGRQAPGDHHTSAHGDQPNDEIADSLCPSVRHGSSSRWFQFVGGSQRTLNNSNTQCRLAGPIDPWTSRSDPVADLGKIATDVIELYDSLAEDKGVALALESAGPGPAELPGDPSLLFEAIGNLVDNAIKFTPAGGRVTVRVVREDGRLGIDVAGTGPGVKAVHEPPPS
jgi:Histidine kinase-, DNA gyrase B-, and HSP90-like ATPase